MYKLFLCLRYLRRRYIALVAIIGMALCVAMVLIVVSVMNGFLNAVEKAAKGIMGDIIVDARGSMPYYDEFIREMKQNVSSVKAATPVVYTYALLRIEQGRTDTVLVVGTDLREAMEVTDFRRGLYPEALKRSPGFRVPEELAEELLRDKWRYKALVARDRDLKAKRERDLDAERSKPEDQQDRQRIAELEAVIDQLAARVKMWMRIQYVPDKPGLILGVDLAGTRDAKTGQYTRHVVIGQQAQLVMLPAGHITTFTEPLKAQFTIVGDARSGVYQIDSLHVYVDFKVLQEKLNMDGGGVGQPLCSQIQVKVADGGDDEEALLATADAIRVVWNNLADEKGMPRHLANIQTWRQRQALYLGPIEKQRDLTTIMFGIISLVAVALVFSIFYMMVVQKTKDIGVLKSIGASSGGVAGIFLTYGAAVGLVGSIIGAIIGYVFVRQINPIHDWIAETFKWRMFDRQAYMFDRIPNEVSGTVLIGVMISAILAGVLGALLPALRAARMQPVEALRYE